MAPIKLKKVLKVSSEDAKYSALNLLSGMKWMTKKAVQTAIASVDIKLDVPSVIHFIDLGFYNVAQIEIQVALSTWPEYREPITLLPAVTLQTQQDVRAGLNKSGCRWFNFNEHLNQEIARQRWDQIRIILQQPYARNKQMGIEHIRLSNKLESAENKNNTEDKNTKFSSWKDSNIHKLFPSAVSSSSSPVNSKLTDKLKRISDSSNNPKCYSRTARMIMTSKLQALKAKKDNGTSKSLSQLNSSSPSELNKTTKMLTPQSNTSRSFLSSKNKHLDTSGISQKDFCEIDNSKTTSQTKASKSHQILIREETSHQSLVRKLSTKQNISNINSSADVPPYSTSSYSLQKAMTERSDSNFSKRTKNSHPEIANLCHKNLNEKESTKKAIHNKTLQRLLSPSKQDKLKQPGLQKFHSHQVSSSKTDTSNAFTSFSSLQTNSAKPCAQDDTFVNLLKKNSEASHQLSSCASMELSDNPFSEKYDCLDSFDDSFWLPKEFEIKPRGSRSQKSDSSAQKKSSVSSIAGNASCDSAPDLLKKDICSSKSYQGFPKVLNNPLVSSSTPHKSIAKSASIELNKESPSPIKRLSSSSLAKSSEEPLPKNNDSIDSLTSRLPKVVEMTQNLQSSLPSKTLQSPSCNQSLSNEEISTVSAHADLGDITISKPKPDSPNAIQTGRVVLDLMKAVNSTPVQAISVDPDVEMIKSATSREPVYTDAQIKLLKKAIKKFFNKLDLESFDPEKHRVKDLRRRFEEQQNMKLNRDGREYFREITVRFMTIYEKCHKHKTTSTNSVKVDTGTKRKSTEPSASPAKIQRPRSPTSHDMPTSNQSTSRASTSNYPTSRSSTNNQPTSRGSTSNQSSSSDYQECPICFGFIEKSLIESHAAFCCGQDDLPDLTPRYRSVEVSRNVDTVVDCSENSCLTKVEQQRWIKFSKEPKPYHERLNTDSFVGCTLVRCPSCGLKYKSSEIEAHCDDCTEKVNSGCTRMGLYLIDGKKKKASKQPTKPIVVD